MQFSQKKNHLLANRTGLENVEEIFKRKPIKQTCISRDEKNLIKKIIFDQISLNYIDINKTVIFDL